MQMEYDAGISSLREMLEARVESDNNRMKKKIKQLEDDLLFRLSNSQGNLLDDVELIEFTSPAEFETHRVNQDQT